MNPDQECCVRCERTSDQIPLLQLKYAGKINWICPQCLPILIHKPQQIAAVAGAWTTTSVASEE